MKRRKRPTNLEEKKRASNFSLALMRDLEAGIESVLRRLPPIHPLFYRRPPRLITWDVSNSDSDKGDGARVDALLTVPDGVRLENGEILFSVEGVSIEIEIGYQEEDRHRSATAVLNTAYRTGRQFARHLLVELRHVNDEWAEITDLLLTGTLPRSPGP